MLKLEPDVLERLGRLPPKLEQLYAEVYDCLCHHSTLAVDLISRYWRCLRAHYFEAEDFQFQEDYLVEMATGKHGLAAIDAVFRYRKSLTPTTSLLCALMKLENRRTILHAVLGNAEKIFISGEVIDATLEYNYDGYIVEPLLAYEHDVLMDYRIIYFARQPWADESKWLKRLLNKFTDKESIFLCHEPNHTRHSSERHDPAKTTNGLRPRKISLSPRAFIDPHWLLRASYERLCYLIMHLREIFSSLSLT